MAFIEQTSFGLVAENRFGLQELSLGGVVSAIPTKVGVFGVSLVHFGDALFSESQLGFAEIAYFDRHTVKSGWEEIEGNKVTEVKNVAAL